MSDILEYRLEQRLRQAEAERDAARALAAELAEALRDAEAVMEGLRGALGNWTEWAQRTKYRETLLYKQGWIALDGYGEYRDAAQTRAVAAQDEAEAPLRP